MCETAKLCPFLLKAKIILINGTWLVTNLDVPVANPSHATSRPSPSFGRREQSPKKLQSLVNAPLCAKNLLAQIPFKGMG